MELGHVLYVVKLHCNNRKKSIVKAISIKWPNFTYCESLALHAYGELQVKWWLQLVSLKTRYKAPKLTTMLLKYSLVNGLRVERQSPNSTHHVDCDMGMGTTAFFGYRTSELELDIVTITSVCVWSQEGHMKNHMTGHMIVCGRVLIDDVMWIHAQD